MVVPIRNEAMARQLRRRANRGGRRTPRGNVAATESEIAQ